MAKAFNKCLGCEQPKLVNYAGLCKRCARNPKYAEIVEHAIEEHEAELENRAEVEEAQVEEAHEEQAGQSEQAAEASEEPEKKD